MYRLLTIVGAVLPAVLAQTFYGCYTEGSSSRALTGAQTVNYTSMTVEVCETYCTGLTFSIWGLEYGGECYCGNELSTGSFQSFSTDCTMSCGGNATETCGGPNRLSLYGSSTEAPAVTLDPHAAVNATEFLGCYTEGVGVRALSGAQAYSATGMTVEACGNYCLEAGYTIFGTEYSAECYCGNSIDTTSTLAASTDCSMACSGNSTELCGGPDRLSVYQWYDSSA
ncbi:putative fungistatic metabolite [Diplogelasinospora grovesii]|uniref:Fungistatic metabolite n=1 Tax=Diplogelasinospora grovesii TaxID=303347 RepID=A0AAN6S8G4_9PEZI|nr:putative fungistatic metabolite [Diplogelasinospora grovesii]